MAHNLLIINFCVSCHICVQGDIFAKIKEQTNYLNVPCLFLCQGCRVMLFSINKLGHIWSPDLMDMVIVMVVPHFGVICYFRGCSWFCISYFVE